MIKKQTLNTLSDDVLLRRLSDIAHNSRRVEAELIAHIAEVDARRLYREQAASSMFVYCTDVLHFSEQEAYLRIGVARAAREHHVLLDMLADGRMHLSGICKLAPRLTAENRDALLKRATHQSKRQIEELVAALQPRPDVPSTMRKLAVRQAGPEPPAATRQTVTQPTAVELGPDRVARGHVDPTPPARLEPLAPERYKVQFTASAELRDKLERLGALTPGDDLATIIEQAVTERIERLEAKRFARTRKPRKTLAATDTSASSRHIPAPVRRAVHERDGGRCTFMDVSGKRCEARRRLEFHHHDRPFTRGGDHRPESIRLMCRTHNLLLAEREYGSEWMDRFRRKPAAGHSSSTSTASTRPG